MTKVDVQVYSFIKKIKLSEEGIKKEVVLNSHIDTIQSTQIIPEKVERVLNVFISKVNSYPTRKDKDSKNGFIEINHFIRPFCSSTFMHESIVIKPRIYADVSVCYHNSKTYKLINTSTIEVVKNPSHLEVV